MKEEVPSVYLVFLKRFIKTNNTNLDVEYLEMGTIKKSLRIAHRIPKKETKDIIKTMHELGLIELHNNQWVKVTQKGKKLVDN